MSPARRDNRRPDIEAALTDEYHVEWTYHPGVPTDEFDIDRSLQNQARFEPLHDEKVEEYREAIERGDVLPPVLAYRPGRAASAKLVSIDGNHRLVSHARSDGKVDVYEIDRGTNAKTITMMTMTFNARHGQPTSEAERMQHAIYLIENGANQEQAAAAMNLPIRLVRKAAAKNNADKRAKEVGLDMREWDSIGQSSKNRLLGVYTDEGFAGAVHLAYAARLSGDEIADLIALLNSSRSGSKQRGIIKSETDRFRDRIQDVAGGSMGRERRAMTPKARVGMVLGQILALPEDFSSLSSSYSETERDEAGERLMSASERLRKLALSLNPSLK